MILRTGVVHLPTPQFPSPPPLPPLPKLSFHTFTNPSLKLSLHLFVQLFGNKNHRNEQPPSSILLFSALSSCAAPYLNLKGRSFCKSWHVNTDSITTQLVWLLWKIHVFTHKVRERYLQPYWQRGNRIFRNELAPVFILFSHIAVRQKLFSKTSTTLTSIGRSILTVQKLENVWLITEK